MRCYKKGKFPIACVGTYNKGKTIILVISAIADFVVLKICLDMILANSWIGPATYSMMSILFLISLTIYLGDPGIHPKTALYYSQLHLYPEDSDQDLTSDSVAWNSHATKRERKNKNKELKLA